MNWEKTLLSKVLPISIALTGIGYFMTFLFQLSYLSTYGIPASLVFIKPELLIIGIAATSVALLLLARFFFNVLDIANMSKNNKPTAMFWRSTFVSILFGGMGLMLALMSMEVPIFFQLFLTLGGIFLVWALGAVVVVGLHAIFKSHNFEKSIVQLNPYSRHLPNFSKGSKKEDSTLDKVSEIMSVLLFVAGLAVVSGAVYANWDKNKVVYSKGGNEYVIISNYHDVHIVKQYYESTKSLGDSFYLVNEIHEPLSVKEIKISK